AARRHILLRKVPPAQHHAVGIALDGEKTRPQAERADKTRDMGVGLEIAHAAQFGDEMRRLRKRHRMQAAADALDASNRRTRRCGFSRRRRQAA
ncbi:MAG TPA: hypothetical protein VGC36_11565, partial [Rhizomicrobium sp.]